MVNLYQDSRITKQLIQKEKLEWCRLMFAIYKLSNGEYERVSPSTYSDLIQESMKNKKIKKKILFFVFIL